MFYDCTSITAAPQLPATVMAPNCYWSMFYSCTGLLLPPELPATTLASSCYSSMFYSCTGMVAPPALRATALAISCYANMLRNCSSLKISSSSGGIYTNAWRIPTSGTGTVASGWNTNMLAGTGGSFVGNPAINTTYWADNFPV